MLSGRRRRLYNFMPLCIECDITLSIKSQTLNTTSQYNFSVQLLTFPGYGFSSTLSGGSTLM
jgi:hypothetical protein